MAEKGKLRRRYICLAAEWVLAAAVAFHLLVGFDVAFWALLGVDKPFDRAFDSVRPGMSRAEVVKLLGRPDEQGEHFRLGQRDGYEDEYERAAKSSSAYYLFWHRGLDRVYAVGFAEGDKVTLAASGGT